MEKETTEKLPALMAPKVRMRPAAALGGSSQGEGQGKGTGERRRRSTERHTEETRWGSAPRGSGRGGSLRGFYRGKRGCSLPSRSEGMEDRQKSSGHGRHLLGRSSESGRSFEGHEDGRGPSVPGDQVGGDPVREPGALEGGPPPEAIGPSCLPAGLSTGIEGWSGPCSQGQASHARGSRGLDGELGGGGACARSRSRRAEKSAREGKEERGRETRGVGNSGDAKGGLKFQQLAQRKEQKEEEKEEERGEREVQDPGHKRFGDSVRYNSAGPQAWSEEKSQKESKESSQEARKERRQQFDYIDWEQQWHGGIGGGSGASLRRGSQGENGGETIPWSSHAQHSRDDADYGRISEWPALGYGPQCPSTHLQCLLEDDAELQDDRAYEPRSSDFVLSAGPAVAGQDSNLLRHHNAAAQGPGAGVQRESLSGDAKARACPGGDLGYDHANGIVGGSQVATAGVKSQGSFSQAMEQRSRVGEEGRGDKRQSEGKGLQEQGQRKGRQDSTEPRGAGQGEAKLRRHGEQECSVERLEDTAGMGATTEAMQMSGIALVPEPFFEADSAGPTGPEDCAFGFSTKGRTFGNVAKNLFSMFEVFEDVTNIPRSKIKFSGGIFPLPECPRAITQALGPIPMDQLAVLRCTCKALNSYNGSVATDRPQVSSATKMAMRSLARTVRDSGLWSEKFGGVRWDDYVKVKSVDYRGEEVQVARRFRWENVEPALPEGIGSIPLIEVCEGGTLDYIVNFERYLLPEESRVYTKPPKVFVDDDAWEQVCSGLLAKGVCRLIPESEVYHLDHRPLLNGLFGVSKQEFCGSVEVFRLIMNLVPVNKLCRSLGSDVCTLPSVTGLGSVVLDEDQVLLLNSEDIKCFFYIFGVPPEWHKFLAFGKPVPSSLVEGQSPEPFYLTSLVLPMGFVSSVSIAQHIHRRIARLSLHSLSPSRGAQCEMRKDKPGSVSPWLYRIYLDNFDALQKVDRKLASLIDGTPSAEALAMREGYQYWGLPRHPKKSVEQALTAEVQGALVDGVTGRVRPKPSKVMKYVELALQLLNAGWANQKQLQIDCGGFVYCAMFRRPMLGMLNRVWSFIMEFEGDPPVIKREIPKTVQLEILRFVCAVPLAQMNMRSMLRGDVTASDASEWGGVSA